MNLISRLFSSLFAITALLFILTSLPADWMLELGAPVDLSGSLRSLLEAQRKGEQLSRKAQSSLAQVAIKDRIGEALTSGKMTLIEAAVCFRSLHEDPKTWHHPSRPCPSHGDDESWCREVIEWVDNSVRINHSADQADALRQRLEVELQEHLDYYGGVKSPD